MMEKQSDFLPRARYTLTPFAAGFYDQFVKVRANAFHGSMTSYRTRLSVFRDRLLDTGVALRNLFARRNSVTIIAVAAVVVCFPPIFQKFYEIWHGFYTVGAGGFAWNERTQEIAMKRYDASVSIFQLTTALLAGIWGIIVLGADKPQQKVANANPERWTIILASTLLIYSGFFHLKYSNLIIEVQLTAETVNAEAESMKPSGSSPADADSPADESAANAQRAPRVDPAQSAFQDILNPMYNASYVGQVTCLLAAAALIALAIATDLWVFEEPEHA